MAKLTGAKKKAFLERMAKGRRKAKRANPKAGKQRKKPAKRKAARAAKKTPKKRKTSSTQVNRKKNRGRGRNPMVVGWKRYGVEIPMPDGIHAEDYFRDGQYLGPDADGVEPIWNPMGMGSLSALAQAFPFKRKKNKGRRRNADDLAGAERMYETFHQMAPGSIREYEQQVQYPGNLAEMGDLIELRFFLDKNNPEFPLTRFGDAKVVCTADGGNIYFIGGDQRIDLETLDIASDKDVIELGPCSYICYHTTKGFHDFAPTKYWHNFGEENGIYPRLGYDRLNRTLFLIGGNYQVKHEGIVN